MEPTAGDLQLVPGTAKEVPAPYTSCCRMALCVVVATSIIMVTLGVLMGKWLWARVGSHTGQLAQRCLEVAQSYPHYDPRTKGLSLQVWNGRQARSLRAWGGRLGWVVRGRGPGTA